MSLDRWKVWEVDSDYDLKPYDRVEVMGNGAIEIQMLGKRLRVHEAAINL